MSKVLNRTLIIVGAAVMYVNIGHLYARWFEYATYHENDYWSRVWLCPTPQTILSPEVGGMASVDAFSLKTDTEKAQKYSTFEEYREQFEMRDSFFFRYFWVIPVVFVYGSALIFWVLQLLYWVGIYLGAATLWFVDGSLSNLIVRIGFWMTAAFTLTLVGVFFTIRAWKSKMHRDSIIAISMYLATICILLSEHRPTHLLILADSILMLVCTFRWWKNHPDVRIGAC